MTAYKKLKIAIIVPGGIGTDRVGVPAMEKIVRRLADNFDVTVFSLFKLDPGFKPDNFKILSITGSGRLSKTFGFLRAFKQIHSREKFDVVHGFWAMPSGLLAVLAAKLFKIKSIVSVLGGDANAVPEINYGELNHAFSRKLVIGLLQRSDEVVALSSFMTANLKRFGLRRNDVRIIPWGIDAQLFKFENNPLRSPVAFLHIGNLVKVKDQVTLLNAFKIISGSISAHLRIIGEGPEEDFLKNRCDRLGLTTVVSFEHPVANAFLPQIYHQSDVLLQTSLSEGQGIVVTEAMACGVLVCSTAVGSIRDMQGCCVAVPVSDSEGLAVAVLELLTDSQRMDELRHKAYDWVNRHNFENTIAELSVLYARK